MIRSFPVACLMLSHLLFSTVSAQDESARGVGVRQQVFPEPLAAKAGSGNAGLFVGVNRFDDDGLTPLQFAVNDAVELAYLFVFEIKLIPAENCWLLIDGEVNAEATRVQQHLEQLLQAGVKVTRTATRANVLRTFLEVKRVGQNVQDILVCFFSSHGFQQPSAAYIMPSDGIRSLLVETAVPLATIEDQMGHPETGSKAGHRLLLIDACQERVAAKGGAPGVAAKQAFFEQLQKPTGQSKLASCSPGEFSYEGAGLDGVGHGVFTYGVLESLRGGAKANSDRLITLEAVADHTAAVVSEWISKTGRSPQTPQLSSAVEGRRLPLARQADDLQKILTALTSRSAEPPYTLEVRDLLAKAWTKLDLKNESDRLLVRQTIEFLAGRLPPAVFVPFARTESERLLRNNKPDQITNSLGQQLVLIPAGSFLMGSPESDADADADEFPQHEVLLTKPIYIGRTEVTQRQWKSLMQTAPWKEKDSVQEGDEFPASWISWDDAIEFCHRLSAQENCIYRLPSEAEWEFACRGGVSTRWSSGDDHNQLDMHAWFRPNALDSDEGYPHAVAQKKSNNYGLYDMHGNVREWCSDWYSEIFYKSRPRKDPTGPSTGQARTLRGGAWNNDAKDLRNAARMGFRPDFRSSQYGFRIVREYSAP
jgi:formylglycine-generating enzyme required for sulfatase activity